MITFESVSKTYRDGTTAVAELDLVLPSDEISIVVGPSGCGKTTMLRMVNRMIEPTSGTISWDGKPLTTLRRTTLRRQMGYVIQNGGLFPHRTVLDNICTVPTLLGWTRARSRSRAVELLGLVGLDRSLAHRFPAQLSGGQQQRVGVARALAADPVLLLMDEPFSAVDPVVRADLQELVKGLQRDLGKTIVMITHDIDEAMLMGDQVVIMRVGGRIAQSGTPDEILDRPADEFVEGFVGKDRGYRALSFATASGLRVSRVRSVRSAVNAGQGSAAVVVDADGRPQGWADASRPGVLLPLGATFRPDHDSLRAVVDAALSSPVGQAVAVQPSGRLAGVVSAADALEAVRQRRITVADEHTPASDPTSGEGHPFGVPAAAVGDGPTGPSVGDGTPGADRDATEQGRGPDRAPGVTGDPGSTVGDPEGLAASAMGADGNRDAPSGVVVPEGGAGAPGSAPGGQAGGAAASAGEGTSQAATPGGDVALDHPRSVDEAVVPLDEHEHQVEHAEGSAGSVPGEGRSTPGTQAGPDAGSDQGAAEEPGRPGDQHGGEPLGQRPGDHAGDTGEPAGRTDEPAGGAEERLAGGDDRGTDTEQHASDVEQQGPDGGPGAGKPSSSDRGPAALGDVAGPPSVDPMGTATRPGGSAGGPLRGPGGLSARPAGPWHGTDAGSQEQILRRTLGER